MNESECPKWNKKGVYIDWGTEGSRVPIRKTHPFQISTVSTFTNPKKRKTEEVSAVVPSHSAVEKEKEKEKDIPLTEKLIKANYILSAYLSLILNMFLIFLFIALVIKFILSVKSDITVKTTNILEGNRFQIEECRRQYVLNKCHPDERVPALEEQCKSWEKCMAKDPFREEITKVVFRVASDAIEEFLNGVSFRTVAITTGAIAILLKIVLSSR
ncbi:hypothetical protein NECID01_1020 [Nematocida sp. AWRm77]|nr:hypothetical protein NECID01_1020 [Nematocida sp. AWRm77]